MRQVVASSPLFDAEWYGLSYPDVKAAGIDPLGHFLERGATELRNPSPHFDTSAYLDRYPDVRKLGLNPLYHYLRHGKREGREISPPSPRPNVLDSVELVASSPLFDAEWYCLFYPDVKAAGVDPVVHFLQRGAVELRNPSSHFDTAAYLDRYPDVRKLGLNPLYHYLRDGKREGRKISPPIVRPHFFDVDTSAQWVTKLRSDRAYAEIASQQPLVSIILPTKDRAAILPDAIRSVLEQTWHNWELLVVDDGSVDGSVEIVRQKFPDPRIKLLRSTGQGVCDARNTGLSQAQGEFFAYLDSDNTWTPEYLELILAELGRSRADAAYAVLKVINSSNPAGPPHVTYRQVPFSSDSLRVRNFIDLNVFIHRRELYAELGGFDPALKRMVDWDLILRYTARHPISFANFIGCNYTDSACLTRISNRERLSYVNVVRSKHLIDWERVNDGLTHRDQKLVSVIICNYEKADLTRLCIESLYRHESGEAFEVILVENGSNPQTVQEIQNLVAAYPGIRLVRNPENYGFALGNNMGFAESRGSRVVFLNNDTEVTPEWLRALVRPLEDLSIKGTQPKLLFPDGSIQCVGVVFQQHSPLGYPLYARQPGTFPPSQQSRNYSAITAACMAMRAEDFAHAGGFDPLYLNGQEDVDLCLRVGRGRRVFRYVADSIVIHHEGQTAGRNQHMYANRTLFYDRWKGSVRADDTEFYAQDGVVASGYRADNADWADEGYAVWKPSEVTTPAMKSPPVPARLRGRTIAIKVPCPHPDLKDQWGDYHFAVSLAAALFRRGIAARIDFLQNWATAGNCSDINLVLRGLSRFTPVAGTLNFMWMISHPDRVSMEELQGYDGVFVASSLWAETLRRQGLSRVQTLLQCTDVCRFHPDAFNDSLRTRNLFVANSRGVLRPIVRAAREEHIPLDLYGQMWEGMAPAEWIRGEQIDNVALAGYYASAEVVLNDHWDSMRECGFVSNRVFDVLASGGSLLTDRVAGFPEELAAECHFFEPGISLREVMEKARRDPRNRSAASLAVAEYVRREHSFDARVTDLITSMNALAFRGEVP